MEFGPDSLARTRPTLKPAERRQNLIRWPDYPAFLTMCKPSQGLTYRNLDMTKSIKPGQTIKDSGIYRDSKSGERTTLVRGKTAPPTPERGSSWKEVVDTNPRDRSSR